MSVSIGVHVRGDNDLTVADLWPDGNAPDPVTAADVVQLIRSCGGVRRVLTDWNLDHDIEVIVRDGDGSHTSGVCR